VLNICHQLHCQQHYVKCCQLCFLHLGHPESRMAFLVEDSAGPGKE
jgi:hypothetical protein